MPVRLATATRPIDAASLDHVDAVRWNRQLSKTFDVTREQFPARTAEQALVSKYLDCEVKQLHEQGTTIASARMGGFLKSLDESLAAASIEDIRNLTWDGKEEPPVYELIQLTSKLRQDFLIDGIRFLTWHGVKLALRLSPGWYGLHVTTYIRREDRGVAQTLLEEVLARAAGYKLLQGEAFALSGEFLTRGVEGWADLFLEPKNERAIRRITNLINDKGAALENRGLLFVGPPGTGKTLSGRLLMNNAKSTFIWISSRDFHRAGAFGGLAYAFDLAREYAPTILFVEDVDNWLDGYSVDLLKTEMDGIAQSAGVVTALTTNYPELLPKALIDRPGRFHDVLEFKLPDAATRTKMLARWLPKLTADDVARAVKATDGYSGAHVRELVRFATIIDEQEQIGLSAALTQALTKLAEQRALITSVQASGSRYRMLPALTRKQTASMHHRAHATLTIKTIDEEARMIRGLATSPTPDRMGDIVEPLGVQFTNPLPLLLYHDAQRPVGTVILDPPTPTGITFTASIAKVQDPGSLKERVDEAWQSLKLRLIRGVSIGFRGLENGIEALKSGGLRFLKTEILELSLVTVPANQEATIHTIKAFDVDQSAALGSADRSVLRAGVPATSPRSRRDRSMKTSISERISNLKAERKTITDRMEALMQPVIDQTGDLTNEQKKEYDDLAVELKETDADLTRFEALERATIMPKAVPVAGSLSDEGATRIPRITVKQVELPPGIEFTRTVICKAAARVLGVSPLEVAKTRYPDYPRIEAHLKAAVTGMAPADTAALVATPQTLTSEFLDYLRPMTIVGQFGTGNIPSLVRVPFNSRIQSQTSGGSANWVGAAKGKPVTKFSYDAATLYWAKIAAIAVIADELVRFSSPSAEARVRDSLTKACIERLDTDFIDPNKAVAANVSPASITNLITPLSHTGTDADAVRVDVQTALNAFIAANTNPTSLVWIMPNSVALALSLMRNTLGQREFPDITMRGGTFEGFPVIASQYAASVQGSPTSNIVALVNAGEIFLADDGGVSVEMSNQATIEMSDDPENDTGAQVNMFQTNQIALRAERYINWARGRSSSVVWFDGVAWATD